MIKYEPDCLTTTLKLRHVSVKLRRVSVNPIISECKYGLWEWYCESVIVRCAVCLSPAGADIDTLLVAPRHIDRSDFFASFHEMLCKEKGVTNVRVSGTTQLLKRALAPALLLLKDVGRLVLNDGMICVLYRLFQMHMYQLSS